MEQTTNYLGTPLEGYGNEYAWPYYQYTPNNDQLTQSNGWTPPPNMLAASAFGYGSYPAPFGTAGSFDWNAYHDPATSLACAGVAYSYGGAPPLIDITSNYHQHHQQQTLPVGIYGQLPSPASSSATPSPVPSHVPSSVANDSERSDLDGDRANTMKTEPNYTVSLLTPPHEQTEGPVEFVPKYAPLKPLETYRRVESTSSLSFVGHSVDSLLLQNSNPVAETSTTTRPLNRARGRKPTAKNATSMVTYASEWHCELCNKRFVRKIGLVQHNNVRHSGERPYPCLKCGKRFADPVLLKRHVDRHQAHNKQHQCDQCPKRFVYRMDLRRHQYQHTGNAPHQCAVCSKAFARRDHMLAHQTTHGSGTITVDK